MKQLKAGDPAPQFSGLDQNGTNIKSKDFQGKKYVVYFYPKDNTPGCTAQACNIQENFSALEEAGISVLGVSADPVQSHDKFATKFKLTFPLIADTDKMIIEKFGVWGEKKFMGKTYDGIHRKTFLIDEQNIIKGIIEKPKTKDHAAEILQFYQNN